jgi:hypothetical protein
MEIPTNSSSTYSPANRESAVKRYRRSEEVSEEPLTPEEMEELLRKAPTLAVDGPSFRAQLNSARLASGTSPSSAS